MWYFKMSNTFCLTVPQCMPYIYSVCQELRRSEKLQAHTVADSRMGGTRAVGFCVQIQLSGE